MSEALGNRENEFVEASLQPGAVPGFFVENFDGPDDLARYRLALEALPALTADQETELAQQMDEGKFADELLPACNPDERPEAEREMAVQTLRALQHTSRIGAAARERLGHAGIETVLDIVATEYSGESALSVEDLVQLGNVGLAAAVNTFSGDCRLAAHAADRIRGEIEAGILEANHHAYTTMQPKVNETGPDEQAIQNIMPEYELRQLAREQGQNDVATLLGKLLPEERHIVLKICGFEGDCQSTDEVAQELNMSPATVETQFASALTKLRSHDPVVLETIAHRLGMEKI